jgi:hypothetical protein
MVDAKERPADGRRSTRWTVAEVLAAVGQAGDNAAAIARTVSDWAALPNFQITGGTGLTYPSLMVLADTGRATGRPTPRSPVAFTLTRTAVGQPLRSVSMRRAIGPHTTVSRLASA